jgi:hypothetical protein
MKIRITWIMAVILCAAAGCARQEPGAEQSADAQGGAENPGGKVEFVEVAAGPGATGTWNVTVDASSGPGTPIFALTQNGDELVGQYKGVWGVKPVKGTVKGGEFTFSFVGLGRNGDVHITYTGKIDGNAMSGKVTMDPVGEGTFTGNKQG